MTFTYKIRGDASAPIAAEFECPVHGRFEATMPRDRMPDALPCLSCDEPSPWRFPAPGAARVKLGELVRGKSDERPPESIMLDTRPLADGMPLAEWRAKQADISRDIALSKARSMRSR